MSPLGIALATALWVLGPTSVCCEVQHYEESGWLSDEFADPESEGVVLLARSDRLLHSSNNPPESLAASLANQEDVMKRTNELLAPLEQNTKDGWLVRQRPTLDHVCGKASFHELGMTIPEWQRQNPDVDGFCHFANYAWWFDGAGDMRGDYSDYGRLSSSWARYPHPFCGLKYAGAGAGPPASIQSDNNILQLANLDSCLDAGDDPYCYSLGWLKGQRLESTNIHNGTEWRAKAATECQRIQETFHFMDQEVTVGAHIFGTSVYLQKSLQSALGTGPPVDERRLNMHAYTKCQLGLSGAAGEMAYCYYKGCVLEDGRIGHGPQCGYDKL